MGETIKFEDYLSSLMSEKEVKSLLDALKRRNDVDTILITGPKLPTGKSILAKVLEKKGYHVIEAYRVHEVTLDEPLNNMIPDIISRIK